MLYKKTCTVERIMMIYEYKEKIIYLPELSEASQFNLRLRMFCDQ